MTARVDEPAPGAYIRPTVKIPPRRVVSGLLLVALACGCGIPDRSPPPPRPSLQPGAFAAKAMRLHPTFTRTRDLTGAGRPTGIEAEIEFLDFMGDPAKARGRVVFELYGYRDDSPDPRGRRLVNPWVGSLVTDADQNTRYNRNLRTYGFDLLYPAIEPDRTYVLAATFEPMAGPRLFSRIILRPTPAETPAAQLPPLTLQPPTTVPVTP